jgi:hypothetical protein
MLARQQDAYAAAVPAEARGIADFLQQREGTKGGDGGGRRQGGGGIVSRDDRNREKKEGMSRSIM